jgi:hypothetical protein
MLVTRASEWIDLTRSATLSEARFGGEFADVGERYSNRLRLDNDFCNVWRHSQYELEIFAIAKCMFQRRSIIVHLVSTRRNGHAVNVYNGSQSALFANVRQVFGETITDIYGGV